MPVTSHGLQVFKRSFDLFLQQMSLFSFAQQFVCYKQISHSFSYHNNYFIRNNY